MRAALLTVLAGATLAGCAGRYDGTWLVFYTLRSDSEDPENSDIGVEYRTLANLYRTADGIAFEFGGSLLTGTRDGKDFSASSEKSVRYLDLGCDTYQVGESVQLDGSFTDDLGFDATLEDAYSEVLQGCDWADDETTTRTRVYDLTGMMLDAAPGAHGAASVAWGYFQPPAAY